MVENKPVSNPAPAGAPAPAVPTFPLGYNGKLLRVNLSNKSIATETLSEEFCRKYLGGAGFIAYYLWKELKPGIDPLGPENKLIFALGPVTGNTLPGASRNCVGAKSPLSRGIAKAESGGFWMAELKRAGYDAIIVEGKSAKPVYLWVHDGQAEIKDAGQLWGKETKETQDAIRAELKDEHIHVAMIGPGGENMVRYACIMEGCFDAAGRGGLGAVMGSKNLKAIAARGHTMPPAFSPDKIKEIRQQMTHPYPQSEFGTGAPPAMIGGEGSGDLPVRNFRDGVFPQVKDIHAGTIKDTIRIGMEGCFGCMIRCKKVVKVEEGAYKVDPAYGGPEYETLAAIGSDCGVGDLKAISRGSQLCNAYSLDSISTGSTIAFAIECYERGLITKKDTGGLELKWGDADLMLKLVEMIAKREGIGDMLAEGTARMSKKIKGSEAFALHVKGLEPGMHDTRVGSALALTYMTAANGADHCHSEPDGLMAAPPLFSKVYHSIGFMNPVKPAELSSTKVAVYKASEFRATLNDSLVTCHFPGLNFEQMVDLIKGLTGWDTGIPELMRIAERTLTLMRLFNIREGLTAEDDKLPERLLGPTKDGALAKYKADQAAYDRMRKYFYFLMGWDSNGVPLPEKVEELGI